MNTEALQQLDSVDQTEDVEKVRIPSLVGLEMIHAVRDHEVVSPLKIEHQKPASENYVDCTKENELLI